MQKETKKYLGDGCQTQITPLIKKIASSFKTSRLELILEILNWVQSNIRENSFDEEKNLLFRKRSSDEIIKSKMATGCTDYALAFIALSRAKKIPTKYVEAIRRKWLDIGSERHIEGHVFAECLIGNKWRIVDPQEGAIRINYQRFVIFAKGLDSWDIGIENIDDLRKKFLDFKKKYKPHLNIR